MRALFDDLTAAGVQLHREGDRLHVSPPLGADLSAFRDRIREHKPALLRELLQREMTALATVESKHFDRARLDALWQQWKALPDPEVEIAALVDQLAAGWQWLEAHPEHPEHDAFCDRWIVRLREYEGACADARRRRRMAV